MKPSDIHHQLCEVYGEQAMNDSMVWRWVRHFNEGRENVHDDPWNGQPSLVNEILVHAVEGNQVKFSQWTATNLLPYP
jgi:hypothetical protein